MYFVEPFDDDDYNIKTYQGIEYLPFLEKLVLQYSYSITDLDVSKNAALTYLDISSTSIKELDLSCNANLKSLTVSGGTEKLIFAENSQLQEFVVMLDSWTDRKLSDYDLSKIPGFHRDRIISVTKAKLSGSKLYPESTKSVCKYYVNKSKTRKATFVFHFKNTYAPENVKGVKVTGQTTTSISCRWNKIKGVDGYRLYAKNLDTGKLEKYVTIPKDSSIKGTVKGLKPGNGYRMVVKGYKKHNKKTYFSYYQYADTRLTLTKPSKLALKAKRISDTEVKLTWKPVELYGYNAGYLLYVKTSPNGKYTRIANVEKSRLMKGEYVATGLKPDKTYYFKMRAYTKISTSSDKCTAYSSYSKEVVAAP